MSHQFKNALYQVLLVAWLQHNKISKEAFTTRNGGSKQPCRRC
jgi:hypothetical protein